MMTEYQIGWRKYVLGNSIGKCDNGEQRRGWMAANKAEAMAMMAEVAA